MEKLQNVLPAGMYFFPKQCGHTRGSYGRCSAPGLDLCVLFVFGFCLNFVSSIGLVGFYVFVFGFVGFLSNFVAISWFVQRLLPSTGATVLPGLKSLYKTLF